MLIIFYFKSFFGGECLPIGSAATFGFYIIAYFDSFDLFRLLKDPFESLDCFDSFPCFDVASCKVLGTGFNVSLFISKVSYLFIKLSYSDRACSVLI